MQVYLDLTLKALQTLSVGQVGVVQGDNIEKDIHGTRQAPVTLPSSPESLLSRAESYTDQALTAGSGLPLARLVKGQALALRGQHKVKCPSVQPGSMLFSVLVLQWKTTKPQG